MKKLIEFPTIKDRYKRPELECDDWPDWLARLVGENLNSVLRSNRVYVHIEAKKLIFEI
jgi:hypothetical protein